MRNDHIEQQYRNWIRKFEKEGRMKEAYEMLYRLTQLTTNETLD